MAPPGAKVWLITGASGMAAATMRLAIAGGARVFFVSRTESECAALAAELGEACGYHVADLSVSSSAKTVLSACLDHFGRLDALYNVAGLSGRRWGDGPLHLCSDEGWRVTLDNNLDSLFYMSRAVIAYWMEQPVGENGLRGTVLNMASVLGVSPEARHFTTHAYIASKSAIIGLSRAMASYYAPHKIRVNAIAPALVRTPMTVRSQNDPAILDYIRKKQPLTDGMVEAEDVARASVFLLSDDSRAITGEVITVDGGWSVSGA